MTPVTRLTERAHVDQVLWGYNAMVVRSASMVTNVICIVQRGVKEEYVVGVMGRVYVCLDFTELTVALVLRDDMGQIVSLHVRQVARTVHAVRSTDLANACRVLRANSVNRVLEHTVLLVKSRVQEDARVNFAMVPTASVSVQIGLLARNVTNV